MGCGANCAMGPLFAQTVGMPQYRFAFFCSGLLLVACGSVPISDGDLSAPAKNGVGRRDASASEGPTGPGFPSSGTGGSSTGGGALPDSGGTPDDSGMPTTGADAGARADAGSTSGGGGPSPGFQLFVGQDTDSLSETKARVTFARSPGVTLYTNLASIDPSATNPFRVLGGIPRKGDIYSDDGDANRVDFGGGVVDFKHTVAEFAGAPLAVGLFLSDTGAGGCRNQPLRAIIGRTKADSITGQANTDITADLEGKYSYYVQQLGAYFKSLGSRRVLLRIGYEFDGLWNCYNPGLYAEAYRALARSIRTIAPNVSTVWQSAAWSRPDDAGSSGSTYDFRFNGAGARLADTDLSFGQPHLERWYPGDEFVDLVGLSYFYGDTWKLQWGADGGGAAYPPPAAQEAVVTFAQKHGKKVFLAESTPQGFDLTKLTRGTIFNGQRIPITEDEIWADWFVPYFAFIEKHRADISGASYINTNWQGQAQWACAPGAQVGASGGGCPSGYWGDTRIHARTTLRDRFVTAAGKL
jgi:hypothetical protein